MGDQAGPVFLAQPVAGNRRQVSRRGVHDVKIRARRIVETRDIAVESHGTAKRDEQPFHRPRVIAGAATHQRPTTGVRLQAEEQAIGRGQWLVQRQKRMRGQPGQ